MKRLVLLFVLAALAQPAPAACADGDKLAARAEAFHEALATRHWSPEGLVLYRVDLRQISTQLRTGEYPRLADTPTFNGLLAGAACARASSAAGAEADQRALDGGHALSGLELLMDVTGEPGLLARSVRRGSVSQVRSDSWRQGPAGAENFFWKGAASMDQYANGLLFASALCRDAFPIRAHRLVVDSARHLLKNDMQIVDVDGQRAGFGDLSPRSGLGFNSIAQLTGWGIFALAAELDPDPRWAEQRDRLRDVYRVGARSRVTNLRLFGITNTSNDLMAFNLYRVLIALARRTGDPIVRDLRHGLYRAWLRVRDDRNPYFTLVFCALEPAACNEALLDQVRDELEAFPLEKRQLPPSPELAKISASWVPGRKWQPRARQVVPIELRQANSFEWKSSPYRLARPGAPELEYTGLDFLVAYWLYLDVREKRGALVR